MCSKVTNSRPYELTFISFTGIADNTMKVCRKCAYKETFGTKGMKNAMKGRIIEEETN
jgi:hypothetical protein